MSTPRRIAVIGAGPKGLYCVERLVIELQTKRDLPDLEVHIFEPHPSPGAGPVYDPDQPEFLRMNFANAKIDMWSRDIRNPDGAMVSGPTFVEYLADHGVESGGTDYAPRRLVGGYLHEGFERILHALRALATVRVHPEAVVSIERRSSSFTVSTATQSLTSDEVLLTTGHRSRTSIASADISPYPVDQPGGLGDVAPRSIVVVRGMGLTAIDVALALTEGRGGCFTASDTPGRFVYERSGLEVGAVLPYSRTGRPMAPKPHPILVPTTDETTTACARGSRVLHAIDTVGSGVFDEVVDALVETSAQVLARATGVDREGPSIVRRRLEELLWRRPAQRGASLREMRAAVEVAFGQRPPGPDWALAMTWRGVYPALVQLTSRRQLDECWPSFSALAAEMERVAFGPPAENAARFLALAETGIVDLTWAAAPRVVERGRGATVGTGPTARQADFRIDAVLDPAGAFPHPSPVVASLLDAGLARITAHSPGLDIRADGTCLGVMGEPTVGLAAVGRPTEGSILGNDTLSRDLHDTPAQWARSALDRLHAVTEVVAP